jgi:cytochrome P450
MNSPNTPLSTPETGAEAADEVRRVPLFAYLRQNRDNPLLNWAPAAFEKPFLRSRILFSTFVTLNDPDHIRHVLVDNADNYVKGSLPRRLLGRGLGDGLVLSEGALWRRQRRIMAPAFQPRRVAELSDAMVDEAEDLAEDWSAAAADGRPLDIHAEMMGLTLRIIVRTMFGSDIAGQTDTVRRCLATVQEKGGKVRLSDLMGLPNWVPRRIPAEAEAAHRTIDGIIDGIIDARRRRNKEEDARRRRNKEEDARRRRNENEDARRRASADDGDLLDTLLAARDPETGAAMDDSQLRDEVRTIFSAGHDTTANALTWTWYLLGQHPDVAGRLEAELDGALGGRRPGHDDLPALDYGRQVVEEAIRLYPPVHTISRQAVSDDRIGSHAIAAGTTVLIVPWVLHRHRRLWDDPETFDPGRFSADRAKDRSRFAYMPFGGGPRICIGAGFALAEARLVLAVLARRFRLQPVDGHVVEPYGLVTLSPRYGLPMTIHARSSQAQSTQARTITASSSP